MVYHENNSLLSYKVNKSNDVNLLSLVTKMAFLGQLGPVFRGRAVTCAGVVKFIF
jgi:hypothetical protein